MENKNKKNDIYKAVKDTIEGLSNSLEDSYTKAVLANLRNSIGKPYSETIKIWSIVFKGDSANEFLGSEIKLKNGGKVILTTLQLYALHQQGIRESVFTEYESEKEGKSENKTRRGNIGYPLKQLRKDNPSEEYNKSIDRRFNTMVTSETFDNLCYHLRHLIKILKSKCPNEKVNYAKLAEDLYWFSIGYEENVRLEWAREYYRENFKRDEKKGEEKGPASIR